MNKHGIVENQTAAANALGCDPELIKRARKMNCPACLPGGRYRVEELRKWIAEHESELRASGPASNKREQKLDEEIRKLRIANDEKERLVVGKVWIAGKNRELAERFKSMLYAKLVDELPADLSNDVATNRVLLRNTADRLLGEVQSWSKEFQAT
jgi:predicted transcriptional regulator